MLGVYKSGVVKFWFSITVERLRMSQYTSPPEYNLKYYIGSPEDGCFGGKNTCMVTSNDYIALINSGFNKWLSLQYPYCDVSGGCPAVEGMSNAATGDCAFYHPGPEEEDSPVVASLILNNCGNENKTVYCNTEKDRREYFRQCLRNLESGLLLDPCFIDVQYIIMPYLVGHTLETVWVRYYLPLIRNTAKYLSYFGKEVILCVYESVYGYIDAVNGEAAKLFKNMVRVGGGGTGFEICYAEGEDVCGKYCMDKINAVVSGRSAGSLE